MDNVIVTDHPLIQHKLTLMRQKETSSMEFRQLLTEITTLMVYEVTKDYELKDKTVRTPIGKYTGKVISGKKVGIVPILRAGLGMVDGFLNLIPGARVGHIGLYRDPETLNPVEYYCKLPNDIEDREMVVLDPMLATGGSLTSAVQFLKDKGANKIKTVVLLAAPEGIEVFHEAHPEVKLYVAAIDEGLNQNAYIKPGLGDAGDRLFGTK